MTPPTRQSPRQRGPRRPFPEPEFGDWRVQLEKPHEAEHLRITPVHVVRRLSAQVQYFQSVKPCYGASAAADGVVPVHGVKQVVRLVIGLCLLLPLSGVMVYALMLQLYHAAPVVSDSAFWQSVPVWYALLGMLVFTTVKYFRLIDPILMFAYVLGHELTHAITALMCFGKVQALSVDLDGGYVDTDTDNLFVSLSPYFVPLWMLLWLGGFYVANWIFPFDSYLPWFYSGFGFWWAFHVYWTLWIIPREQPDLLENGVVLSFMIILLCNVVALLLMLRGFGVISFHGYCQDFMTCAVEVYTTYHDLALWLLRHF